MKGNLEDILRWDGTGSSNSELYLTGNKPKNHGCNPLLCYYGLAKQIGSNVISSTTKVRLYNTLIRPVLMGHDEHRRKSAQILRTKHFKALGLMRIGGGRTSTCISCMVTSMRCIFIKLGRCRWAGYVRRMNDSAIAKKLMNDPLEQTRRVGRPRMRWVDGAAAGTRQLLNPHPGWMLHKPEPIAFRGGPDPLGLLRRVYNSLWIY